ncbi:MAG: methytransferase partner Trm112 [Dehalococcoidia bacterium]
MKKDLMEILACPVCKGELELQVELEEGDDVIEGALRCAPCNETYPITDAIPNLLPPQMRT